MTFPIGLRSSGRGLAGPSWSRVLSEYVFIGADPNSGAAPPPFEPIPDLPRRSDVAFGSGMEIELDELVPGRPGSRIVVLVLLLAGGDGRSFFVSMLKRNRWEK